VHFDCLLLEENTLIDLIQSTCRSLLQDGITTVPSRIVHLPLSWDDEQCRVAIEKYDQVVRKDAPWYPSNIEFIRRINGLDTIDDVKRVVFDASYLVLGLGDVYLGAPVATPVDPRHRLVTTKYNPARTWTAENSVGIGGSYLCIYGMEGPGGYQFVGRTLQMWNIYRQNNAPIDTFRQSRQRAFDDELQRWKETGQYQFEETQPEADTVQTEIADGMAAVESPAAGSVWKILVEPGDTVTAEQPVLILESMKMEITVYAGTHGTVAELKSQEGTTVEAGSVLMLLTDQTTAAI